MRDDTQKALHEYDISTLGVKKYIEAAENFLSNNENVMFVMSTNFVIIYNNPTQKSACVGVVFLTDKRMLLYYKPNQEEYTDITNYDEIKKVYFQNDDFTGGSCVMVQTNDRIYKFPIPQKNFSLASKKRNQKIAMIFSYVKETYGSKNSNPINKEYNQTSDILTQIEKLASLKDKGIITEAEFNSKKADLLARL